MSVLDGIGLFLAGYLLLIARSAWKQGEFRQFAVSLAVVGGLILAILAAVLAVDLLAGV
jgi:hypothetical protein